MKRHIAGGIRLERDRLRLLAALAVPAVAFPAIGAEAGAKPRAGILVPGGNRERWLALRMEALRAVGWGPERLQLVVRVPANAEVDAMAAELVGERVDVLMTAGTPKTLALRRATTRIPIITSVTDPISTGLARSLRSPGTNVTGLATLSMGELAGKQFEFLREIVPGLARIGILHDAGWSGPQNMIDGIHESARRLGLTVIELGMRGPEDVPAAMERLRGKPRAAAHIPGEGFGDLARAIIGLALESHLPTHFDDPACVERGALVSYSLDHADPHRTAAVIADRILRGADPASIPFELPTRSQLVVNRATARAIGVEIPPAILLRADRVFE